MTIVWTITLLIVVGGLTAFGLKLKSENVDNIMEKNLVNQAKKYMGLYPGLYPEKGKTFRINSDDLKQDGYDAELSKGCNGYVIVSNGNAGFGYKAYVNCPNYTTKGYEDGQTNSPFEESSSN